MVEQEAWVVTEAKFTLAAELLAAGVTKEQIERAVIVMALIGPILERACAGDTTVAMLALAAEEQAVDYQRRSDRAAPWSDLRPLVMRWLAAEEAAMQAAKAVTS